MGCQFEYRFNSSKTAIAAREKANVPLMLARNGRLATGPYEMYALLGKAVASGRRSIGIGKPEPMFGVSSEILQKHGESAFAANTVLAWKKIAPLINEEQRKEILASNDAVFYRADKSGHNYAIVPLRMLYRPGIDIGWKSGSEFGPIVPRQYVRTGDVIQVENPYAAQEPEFLIRVMNGFNAQGDAKIAAPGKSSDGVSNEGSVIKSYNIGAGLKGSELVAANEISAASSIALLQPKAHKIVNIGDHQFTDDGDALKIQFENKRNETIVNDDKLPYWSCSSNMEKARGIGLTVTGDGSRAVLVLQAHCSGPRDYVVSLDFKGTREIIIPCGEVSWADARWGWRFDTKDTKYGILKKLSMGLGKVPPNTTVNIKVGNIRVLPEIPTQLNNPLITVGTGAMKITGSVKSGCYLWYRNGNTVGVFDENWNKLADLPAVKTNYAAPRGKLELRVDSKDSTPLPWLECQFFVRDTPMILSESGQQSNKGK